MACQSEKKNYLPIIVKILVLNYNGARRQDIVKSQLAPAALGIRIYRKNTHTQLQEGCTSQVKAGVFPTSSSAPATNVLAQDWVIQCPLPLFFDQPSTVCSTNSVLQPV
eukprot:scaffold10174_cov74-Cylindrotheca_fusiformis.AAC.1